MRCGRAVSGVLAVLIAGVALLTVSVARAGAMPGPPTLSLGFVDDPSFEASSLSNELHWEGVARQLGSTSVRLGVDWANVAPFTRPRRFNAAAPSDGNYNFAALDTAVKAASAAGQSIILVVFHAPVWAEGANIPATVMPGSWFPNPQALRAFARALASRYSGRFRAHGRTLPHVAMFQAWNEPNLTRYLTPQWYRASNGAIVPASPDLYRALLNAFYAGVKSVQPQSTVLAAGTAPYGDPPGGGRMAPVTFWRALFCINAALKPYHCAGAPHADVFDHHPYALTPTVKARYPDDVATPDFGKLWRILRAAVRWGHVLPGGPKSIWCTEIDWASGPPADTPARQLQYLPLGIYELWRQGIGHVYWFQLVDPLKDNSFNSGGLFTQSGIEKPAAAAYAFPFVALRAKGKEAIVWGKAPHAGVVDIEEAVRTGWKRLFTLRTTSGAVFYARHRVSGHRQLRAVMDGSPSPPYTM